MEHPELLFSSTTAFRFPSRVTTSWEENNHVHGHLYACGDDWKNKPTVILVHGWNAEYCYRLQFPRLARRLCRSGINTVTLELPYHLQRRPRREGAVSDFISSDLPSMLEATEQSLADIHAIAAWLRAQGNPCVGLWGFSLGAWLSGLAICADEKFDFCALLTPVVRIDRAIEELDFCEPIRRALEQHKVPLAGLDLLAHQPRIPRENILLIESKYDVFLAPETIEDLWTVWGQPEIWRVSHGHISIMMSFTVFRRVAKWIEKKVGKETTKTG